MTLLYIKTIKGPSSVMEVQEHLADKYRLIMLVVLAENLKIQTDAFSFV